MMVDTIGFIELSSIAGGIEIVDAMLKVANINLNYAKASCPGKYYVLISGRVSDVEKAINLGVSIGKGFVVASAVIPRVSEKVIRALDDTSMPDKLQAVGVIEFYTVMGSILAADTAVKTANVEILSLRLGTGIAGKSFLVVTGDPSSCTQAVNAAALNQKDSGMLVNKIVIPNPRKELIESLF
jgi:microcompartment protein CcmL/EutN